MKITNKLVLLLLILLIGLVGGVMLSQHYQTSPVTAQNLSLDDQQATVRAIQKVNPAVVSLIVYDQQQTTTIDLSTGQQTISNEKTIVGSGTGFLISADGLILTNKHVVNSATDDKTAEYRVILNSGKQYYAQLIGKDPLNDLAVIKIFDKNLPFVQLGDSDSLQIGSTVIAIGNTLGRYQNSATKGIVSGLGRSLEASDQAGNAEALDNVIQTDAEINLGNSGGPLVDLSGNIVGINVAVDQSGASIGFAIPINDAKPVINSVKIIGRIVRSRLGVRYFMLTPQIAQDNNLPRTSGAWINQTDDNVPAILPGSPADKAGLQVGDIIFEVDGVKIDGKTTLLSVLQKYKPGQAVGFKVQQGSKILIIKAVLDEFK